MKKYLAAMVILILVSSLLSSCGFGSVDDLKKDISPESESNMIDFVEDGNDDTYNDSVSDDETLSDSYESFQFMIFGEVYTLPISYSDMLSKGWVLKKQVEKTVSSGQYESEWFVKDNIELYCYIRNFDNSNQPYSKCYISEVCFDYDISNSTEFVLPGNIRVNESTIDDVLAAYGNDADQYSGISDTINLSYNSSNGKKEMLLVFEKETKVLKTAYVKNNVAPKGYIKSSVNKAEYIKYEKPVTLGTGISDKIISYDGVIYSLGCPLSEFLNNGWEISGSETENDIVGGGETVYINLTYKDDFRETDFSTEEIDDALFGYYVWVTIQNFADDARLLKNCGVCDLDFCDNIGNYEMFASRFGYSFDLSSEKAFAADYKASGVDFTVSSKTDDNKTIVTYSYEAEDTITVNDKEIEVYYYVDVYFTDGMLSEIRLKIYE